MGGNSKAKEDIQFAADISVQRIFEDGLLDRAKTEQAFNLARDKNYTLYDVTRGYNSSGFYQFTNWRNFAKWYSPDHLPDYSLYSIAIPEDTIKEYVYTKEGTRDVADFSIGWGLVKTEDWVIYRLQELINLNAGNKLVTIDNKLFLYQSYTENETSATNTPIQAVLNTVTNYVTTTTVRTEINIIPLSETEDTKITTVTENIVITFGSIELSNISTELSRVETTVPKDTEKPSLDSVVNTETTTQTSEQRLVTVNPQPLTAGYIVSYTVINRYKLFIYYSSMGNNADIGQTLIPSITTPATSNQSFEAVPTVLLRSNFFSIDEHDVASKQIPAGDDTWDVSRPSYINEKREYEVERILNSVGLNVSLMLSSINENPDIDKVSDAYLTFGVAPTDQSSIVSKALFLEFDRLYNVSPDPSSPSGIGYQEQPYNQGFSWSFITKETKDGNVANVFEYKHRLDSIEHINITVKVDKDGNEYTEEQISTTKVLIIQYQLSENRYTEIVVDSLQYATVVGQSHSATVLIEVDDSKDRCIFPITAHMLDSMTPLEMIELLERSFHIVFYGAQLYITELEWYQTGIFQIVLQVIALIVMVIGVIYGDGGTTGGYLMAFAKALAISVALQLAFKVIMEFVDDPYLKAALMVVATIAATYAGGGSSAFDGLDDMMLTAVKLIDIATTVWTGEIAIMQEQLVQDRTTFNEEYNKRLESINEVQSQFNGNLLTSEFLADLSLDTQEDTVAVMINPSVYYDSVFSTGTAYHLLFSSGYDSVNTFYDNKYDYYLDIE